MVGIVSLPFHLVMALSGVVFGLHDEFYDAQNAVVYDGQIMRLIRGHSPMCRLRRQGRPGRDAGGVQQLLRIIHERFAHFQPVAMSYFHAGDSAASVLVRGEDLACCCAAKACADERRYRVRYSTTTISRVSAMAGPPR